VINNCGNQDICTILKPSLEELGCPTKLFITGGHYDKKNLYCQHNLLHQL
jgi:hypothetical protein